MEVSASAISMCDSEEQALKVLLDAFSRVFSLEEIASAYCKAEGNVDLAGQILSDMQESTLASSNSVSNGKARVEESTKPSNVNFPEKPVYANGQLKTTVKQKWRPVSAGSVSSVLGKEYVKSMPAANASSATTKPLKFDAKESEQSKPNLSVDENMQKEMEDFLFKMLGDGFQLGRDVIHQILDQYGYDMQKSMDRLLAMSAVNCDNRMKLVGKSAEKVFPDSAGHSHDWPSLSSHVGATNRVSNTTAVESADREKDRRDLQKEVLASLFDGGYKLEELPRRPLPRRATKTSKRSLLYGEPVVAPPTDYISENIAHSVDSWKDNGNGEVEEDDYELLLRAVKEYRVTMKEYYKAAVDAFAKGEYDLSNKLMDQGHFYLEKAREADEESQQKIFKTKNAETEDEMTVDVHDSGAKEAVRLLNCHLSNISGLSAAFKCLKVIIDSDEEDTTKGARRRMVVKLLEKKSIKWTEGGDAGTIIIPLEDISPTLTF